VEVIYHLEGTITHAAEHFAVVDVHGCGYKVMMPRTALARLTVGVTAKIFTHQHTSETALDLYGFPREDILQFFEQLISVSGVGPKLALAILDAVELKDLAAAIEENRPDLIAQAPGVGRKTAERVILELRGKLAGLADESAVRRMDTDTDLIETLVSLGYKRDDARNALRSVSADIDAQDIEARLKKALGYLSNRK
jgi:Holliday junction DNA helicase RuvA